MTCLRLENWARGLQVRLWPNPMFFPLLNTAQPLHPVLRGKRPFHKNPFQQFLGGPGLGAWRLLDLWSADWDPESHEAQWNTNKQTKQAPVWGAWGARRSYLNLAWGMISMRSQDHRLQLPSTLQSSDFYQLKGRSWLIKASLSPCDTDTNICDFHITSHLIILPSTITTSMEKQKF